MGKLKITNTSSQKVNAPKAGGSTKKPAVVKGGDLRSGSGK